MKIQVYEIQWNSETPEALRKGALGFWLAGAMGRRELNNLRKIVRSAMHMQLELSERAYSHNVTEKRNIVEANCRDLVLLTWAGESA